MKRPSAKAFFSLFQRYNALKEFDALPDLRARPRFSLSQVARALVLGPAFGFDSLMRIDEFIHRPQAVKMGVASHSDSLIQQLAARIPLRIPQTELRLLYKQADSQGLCKLVLSNPQKPQLRVGHIDGTHWMTHHWVFLVIAGAVDLVARLRWMKNIGEELKESQAMIREILQERWEVFPELLTYDGKHVDYPFLKELTKYGVDFLIRIRGDDGRNLHVVKEIDQRLGAKDPMVQEHSGTDLSMNCDYTVYRVPGIVEPRTGQTLVGFRMIVRYHKGPRAGKAEVHDGITSAEYLNAQDLWVVRKSHWGIETLFNRLKREFWSRRGYQKEAHEAQVVGSLVCLSLNLLVLYDWECRQTGKPDGTDPRSRRPWTLDQLRVQLLITLVQWYGLLYTGVNVN